VRVRFPRLFRRLAPRYGPHYGVAAQGVLRGLGLVYILAFWSMASQIPALNGPEGLQPLGALMSYFREQAGGWAPAWFPSLLWISVEPAFLLGVMGCGALAGVGLLYGFFPWVSGGIAWVCWVSLLQVCQPWMSVPGDLLMAEVGLVALFLTRPMERGYPPTDRMASRLTGIVLLNGVLCKAMFSSGMAQLGGDAAWGKATALFRFFETQPLPTAFAWHLHHLPETLLKYGVWGLLFLELALPFYVVLPRIFRNMLAGGTALVAVGVLMCGYHGFLPPLLLVLAFSLVDDVSWRRVLPEGWGPPAATSLYRPGVWGGSVLLVWLPLLTLQTAGVPRGNGGGWMARPWMAVEAVLGRAHASNRYGWFSEIPDRRYELSIQGSVDGRQWIEYRFKLKPTDPRQLPHVSMLHLPRLDERFVQLAQDVARDGSQPPPSWLLRLAERLLVNDPRVLTLFPGNPFPDAPPRFLRFGLYEYRFADPVTRREKGLRWEREFKGFYGPVFRRT